VTPRVAPSTATRCAAGIAVAIGVLPVAAASCGVSNNSEQPCDCGSILDATTSDGAADSAADSTGAADGGDSSAVGGDSSSGRGDAEAGGDASDLAAPPAPDGSADAYAALPGDGSTLDCPPPVAQVIYVLSDANELYTFDPTKFPLPSAFALVGTVRCVPSGHFVNAMAIDRRGTAYVNFDDGSIVTMTTTPPLACTATPFLSGQASFTRSLEMAFAADARGSASETLFVSDTAGPGGACTQSTPGLGCTGRGLAKLDVHTWNLTPLGAFTGAVAGYDAALAGTGDATLYGLFTTTPLSYGRIDTTSGHTDAPAPTVLSSVSVGTGGAAFSFWGGDFYFFTAPTGTTVPQHLATSTGMVTSGSLLSFVVVAAAVSTCAPTTPPQ
jgi:hypothetical protein